MIKSTLNKFILLALIFTIMSCETISFIEMRDTVDEMTSTVNEIIIDANELIGTAYEPVYIKVKEHTDKLHTQIDKLDKQISEQERVVSKLQSELLWEKKHNSFLKKLSAGLGVLLLLAVIYFAIKIAIRLFLK